MLSKVTFLFPDAALAIQEANMLFSFVFIVFRTELMYGQSAGGIESISIDFLVSNAIESNRLAIFIRFDRNPAPG